MTSMGPTITTLPQRDRGPATSIPHALARAFEPIMQSPVLIGADGQPTEREWAEWAQMLRHECHRMAHRFEPDTRIGIRRVRSVGDLGTVEQLPVPCIVIEATTRRRPLDMRVFVLTWENHGLHLEPHTHNAWCEAWRSQYSPDVEDERPRCTEHTDCREHPELGRACWEASR